jgi:manganese/iron transport system substrate-binding protein
MSLARFASTALALALSASGCASNASTSKFDNGKIDVVTTISTLNSFVQGVGGNKVRVTSIVPVGASPETYEPTPQDVATITKAQVLVENGAGLETWLDRLLRNAASPKLQTVIGSEGLAVIDDNPHLWMDPQYAKHYVLQIRDGLIAVDPTDANTFRINAMHYNDALDSLTAHIRSQIQTIPPSQRYMIVMHNAWQYYNNRFGITTLGFVERNPGQEPNPQEIANLVDLAKKHNVHGIFSEPEYSPKLLYTIAQGANIKVVENLYDDSIGTSPQVGNYLSMLVYDTNIIVNALK